MTADQTKDGTVAAIIAGLKRIGDGNPGVILDHRTGDHRLDLIIDQINALIRTMNHQSDALLLQALVENIPIAVFLKDAKDDFKVTLWNRAAEDIFEVPRDAVLGKTAHDLWPKDQADLYLAADQQAIKSGIVTIPEEPSHSKTRGTLYLRTTKLPLRLHDDHEVSYLLCLSQDITGQKALEEQVGRERAKSLKSAKLASLGEMSAGIAHEINNPLAIISGAIRLLKRDLEVDPKGQQRLEDIDKATNRIATIVNGLRKFSRSSEERVAHEVIPIHRIIAEALTLTVGKAKQCAVAIEFDGRPSGFIRGAEIEIEQVLVNLINNAIDAVQGHPQPWVKITAFEQHQQVIVQLRDSGHGIPEQVRQRLFEPFFTTKPVGQGTGLGLSITKGILDDHKATIEVLSDDPNTCFEICFPAAKGPEDAI